MDDFAEMLFAGAERLQLPAGTFLFHAHDTVRFVHLVEDGEISLQRVNAGGQVTCFQRAGAGDILAEASVYALAYHCDARVTKDVRLRRVRKSEIRARLRKDQTLADAWAAQLARKVQKTRLIAEIRSFKTVGERLDAWLGEFNILPGKGRWQSLAHELAVSPEALYRELAKRRG